MKLKRVVTYMSVLGLVSCPAFAGTAMASHRHHHVGHYHMMAHDYKGMGALPMNCQAGPYDALLDVMSQNTGRAKPTEDCNKLIAFAGGINFDAHWGHKVTDLQGLNSQRLSINDAYLNVFGNVNSWTKAFMSFSYGDPGMVSVTTRAVGQYSNVYTNSGDNKVTLEQGFIRFANFDQYPVFVQVGKQFTDFGRYKIHPIHRTVTQSLSETLRTSAVVGFILPNGLHGDVSVFDSPLRERSDAPLSSKTSGPKTIFGASLGFDMPSDHMGWGVNASYLSNMVGVNDVEQAVSQTQTSSPVATSGGSYRNRVSALALDGTVNSGPFSLIGDYVVALKRFNKYDLLGKGSYNGARPWGANVRAAYAFNALGKDQSAYVGYEVTGAAVNLHLPRTRLVAGVDVDMWKNAKLSAEFAHDTDYTRADSGTGNSYNTVGVRAAVMIG